MSVTLPRTDLAFTGALASTVGLKIEDGLDFDDWKAIGKRVSKFAGASTWWLADWLAYGQWEYGRRYEEALAETGLDYGTLRNYASVASRVEASRRRDKLSFAHHDAVAALDPEAQESWLVRAEAEGLSVAALREEIRPKRQITRDTTLEQLRLTAPAERAERWKAAAEREGLEFGEWAANVLDEAA